MNDAEVRIAKEEHLGITTEKRVQFKDFAKRYLEYSKANKAHSSFKRNVVSIKNL